MNYTISNGYARIDSRFLRGPWARQVGAYGVAVYSILVSFADNDSHQAWPSHQTMADLLGCSRRTIIRTVASLERYNIIRRSGPLKGRRQRSNLYTLLPPEQWRRPGVELQPAPDPNCDPPASATGDAPVPQRHLPTLSCDPPSLTNSDSRSPHLDWPALSCVGQSPINSDSPAPELDSLFLTNTPCSDEHGPAPPVKALKKGKKRRPKVKEPPVEAYRTVTGRYPPRASEALIVAGNISSEADLAFWQEVIRHWIACGWSPQNLKGMLDCYQERRLPTTRPAGGYRSERKKGAYCDIYPNGGYRAATEADFNLPPDPE